MLHSNVSFTKKNMGSICVLSIVTVEFSSRIFMSLCQQEDIYLDFSLQSWVASLL